MDTNEGSEMVCNLPDALLSMDLTLATTGLPAIYHVRYSTDFVIAFTRRAVLVWRRPRERLSGMEPIVGGEALGRGGSRLPARVDNSIEAHLVSNED